MIRICYFFIIVSIIVISSCSLNDESVMDSSITEVTSTDLMKGTISQVVYNQSAIGGRMSGGMVQYFKDGGSSLLINEYLMGSSTFENMWSSGYYGGSLVNLSEMKDLAQKESNVNVEAIANILLAHEFGALTNMFGDIPMSEALLKDKNLTPSYDSQEEVYIRIISFLDDAIDQIGNGTFDGTLLNVDLVYNGNMQGWKEFAFGLKARYLLNLSKRDPSLYTQILDIVTLHSFASRNDQADFNFDFTFPNPIFEFSVDRPSSYFTGDYFVSVLFSDPRSSSYTFESQGNYNYAGNTNLTWVQENTVVPLLSYAELKFMEAEILHLKGSSLAATALAAAMRVSFEETTGLTQSALNYIDMRSDFQFLPQADQQYERIMDEAYKAYYGYSHQQSWNNYRRTGYPVLGSTASALSDINLSNIVPRRFPYPISEFNLNVDNLNEAIIRQNGNLLDDDLWIFK